MPTERPRSLRARIGDDEASPLKVWERGRRMTNYRDENGALLTPDKVYSWRMKLHDWAVKSAPAQPEANPTRTPDLSKLPSLF